MLPSIGGGWLSTYDELCGDDQAVEAQAVPAAANDAGDDGGRIYITGEPRLATLASKIAEELKAAGFEVEGSLDERATLKPGSGRYTELVESGIGWTAAQPNGRMLVLLSPMAVARPSGICANELTMALYKGLNFVPVMVSVNQTGGPFCLPASPGTMAPAYTCLRAYLSINVSWFAGAKV